MNGVLFYCLATYTGISYILQASRCPCGTYKAGRWLCTPLDSELGTRSSGLGVPLGNAEHGRQVVGDMRGTLDVDPNLNGILPLHHTLRCLVSLLVCVLLIRNNINIIDTRALFDCYIYIHIFMVLSLAMQVKTQL